MRNGHTLGQTRRAGREYHISQIGRSQPPGSIRIGDRTIVEAAEIETVEVDDPAVRRHLQVLAGHTEHDPRARCVHHPRKAFGRMIRIERNVPSASLEDGIDRDEQLDRTSDAHAHQRLRADPERNEIAGRAVDPRIEVSVGERGAFELQRNGFRCTADLLVERVHDGVRVRADRRDRIAHNSGRIEIQRRNRVGQRVRLLGLGELWNDSRQHDRHECVGTEHSAHRFSKRLELGAEGTVADLDTGECDGTIRRASRYRGDQTGKLLDRTSHGYFQLRSCAPFGQFSTPPYRRPQPHASASHRSLRCTHRSPIPGESPVSTSKAPPTQVHRVSSHHPSIDSTN